MGKKIALAIPSLANGGAERVVSVWANELHARGWDVSIIVFRRAAREYDISPDIPRYVIAGEEITCTPVRLLKRYLSLRGILKQIDPDDIISFLSSTQAWVMLTSWGLRVKRIETLRNNPHQGEMYTNLFYRAGWRVCFLTGHKIILQASGQLRFFGKLERKKCVIVPNPISDRFMDHFKRDISEKPVEFVAAGRLVSQKNYRMMIDAFARAARRHGDIRLRIFGKGEDADAAEIRRRVKEAGMEDRIQLMGWTPCMEEEYQKSDIFLMTSDYEGLPNALMEAMASRLICISTDCETGPRDLIEDGVTGFLVPVGDSAAFAEAIERALQMSARERTEMADGARRKILEHCSLKNTTDALCRCLEE